MYTIREILDLLNKGLVTFGEAKLMLHQAQTGCDTYYIIAKQNDGSYNII